MLPWTVTLVLPFIPSEGNYRFQTTIEDVPYVFDVRWNERDVAWYFDLFQSDGVSIELGIKVVLNAYLGRTSTHSLFQRGVLAAIDTSGAYAEPGFDDLGTRVEVRYYSVSDLVHESMR